MDKNNLATVDGVSPKYFLGQDRHEESQNQPSSSAIRNNQTGSKPEKKRERLRIYFMVPSTNALCLIGTRGVNTKRIEEQTNYTLNLTKMEFPVESNGNILAACEFAKSYIEKFLISNGNTEEKKKRSRPKVPLKFSPNKFQLNQASTPKKESATDEYGNF